MSNNNYNIPTTDEGKKLFAEIKKETGRPLRRVSVDAGKAWMLLKELLPALRAGDAQTGKVGRLIEKAEKLV